jgi:pilus assembly protein CpaC
VRATLSRFSKWPSAPVLWLGVGAIFLCVAQVGAQVKTVTQESSNELSVVVGKSVLIECAQPAQRVVVGLGDIVVATAMSPTEILLNGKAPGETSLIIWEKGGGRQFFNVTVRPLNSVARDELGSVRRELQKEMPGEALSVSGSNGNIFLRGTVKDLNASARAVEIASTAGKVVNLLNIDVPPAEQQILLKVRFASVDRSLEKQMGINLFDLGLGNVISGISTGQFSPPTVNSASTGTGISGSSGATAVFPSEGNILAYFPGLNAGATIEALETKGVVQVLAEPNLLAENGKQASFLAGGEYPYPVVQGGSGGSGSSVTIQFKEYGIRLNFIPTITPRGTIRLQVAPEVSSLDFTNAVEVSGFDVPAIDTRKVKTEVELSDGQTFVIGGLLDNRDTETYEKVPFLGDIPVLGKFFQSMQKTRTNTELIVIITPELVNPIAAGVPMPNLKYPTKFLAPNSNIPMHTPDEKPAGQTPVPAPTTIPVEKLVDSMKPEAPLQIDSSSSGTFGAAGTAGAVGH